MVISISPPSANANGGYSYNLNTNFMKQDYLLFSSLRRVILQRIDSEV